MHNLWNNRPRYEYKYCGMDSITYHRFSWDVKHIIYLKSDVYKAIYCEINKSQNSVICHLSQKLAFYESLSDSCWILAIPLINGIHQLGGLNHCSLSDTCFIQMMQDSFHQYLDIATFWTSSGYTQRWTLWFLDIPSRQLPSPRQRHFWKWVCFSQAGIC